MKYYGSREWAKDVFAAKDEELVALRARVASLKAAVEATGAAVILQSSRADQAEASAANLADVLRRIADSFHGIKPPEGPCVHIPYVWAIEALEAYRSKQ